MKANNVQIGNVLEDRVGFKDVESALVTLKQNLKQKSIGITKGCANGRDMAFGRQVWA